MAFTATEFKHIVLDERNVPFIQGTTMKVIEVVMAQQAYGWTAEEIHINHRYLSMSQIYAALAYYWENKQEIDQAIEKDLQFAEAMRQERGKSPFVARMQHSVQASQWQPDISALDAARRVMGVVGDGPADLSTNPKYMDGFGE